MAADAVLFVGWNRPKAGREPMAVEMFGSYIGFLTQQVEAGVIESFEPVILEAHGGDLNGMILIRGERSKLDELQRSEEQFAYMVKGQVLLDGLGIVSGFTGEGVMRYMAEYQRHMGS